MHYANGFLLCRPFLCHDDEHTFIELINEQAAAAGFLFSTEYQLRYWLKSQKFLLKYEIIKLKFKVI